MLKFKTAMIEVIFLSSVVYNVYLLRIGLEKSERNIFFTRAKHFEPSRSGKCLDAYQAYTGYIGLVIGDGFHLTTEVGDR